MYATCRLAGSRIGPVSYVTAHGVTYEDCIADVRAQLADGHEIVALEVIRHE